MTGSSIHKIALEALRTRTLARLPFAGGDTSRVRAIRSDRDGEIDRSEAIAGLVDRLWEAEGAGRYDGSLMGITDAAISEDIVSLTCRTIRYRDYLATDRVLKACPGSRFSLAVGVHTILSSSEGVVCLRLQDGRIALPGGAVDAADLRDSPGDALLRAATREVAEETGLDIRGCQIDVTGLYVGGYPTHVLAMLSVDLEDADIGRAIHDFLPEDAMDRVESIEARPLPELLDTMWDLPLVVRAALQSLRHRQGHELAWTIPT
jgi:8-oxo-dGTP pyrophosphatase MutT (NUDIX family)